MTDEPLADEEITAFKENVTTVMRQAIQQMSLLRQLNHGMDLAHIVAGVGAALVHLTAECAEPGAVKNNVIHVTNSMLAFADENAALLEKVAFETDNFPTTKH